MKVSNPQLIVICPNCRRLFAPKKYNIARGGGKYCSNECKIIHNTNKIPGGCWEWMGTILKCGYGVTKDYDKKKQNVFVHL